MSRRRIRHSRGNGLLTIQVHEPVDFAIAGVFWYSQRGVITRVDLDRASPTDLFLSAELDANRAGYRCKLVAVRRSGVTAPNPPRIVHVDVDQGGTQRQINISNSNAVTSRPIDANASTGALAFRFVWFGVDFT